MATTPPPAKTRDPWFDNAKMALVTLVVLGHSWTLLPTTRLNDHLYDFLYFWHVPAFVLVTGYLSRSFSFERRRLWQLVRTVVVPYLLFECALALFRVHVGGERLEDLFTDPHWPMWYLSALFFWRLATPLLKRLRALVAVGAAVVVSLVAGLYAPDTLDLARVLGLLPFFVLGLTATPERLERLRARGVQLVGVGVLAVLAVAAAWTDRWGRTEWLYYRARYAELDVSDGEAFLIRACLLVVGAAGACAFLALVPRVSGWFTRMGAYTLVVYLFHGFVVKGAEYAGWPAWATAHPVVSLVLTSAAAIALALLLAWTPLAQWLTHAVDPFGLAEREVRDGVRLTQAGQEVPVLEAALAGAPVVARDGSLAAMSPALAPAGPDVPDGPAATTAEEVAR